MDNVFIVEAKQSVRITLFHRHEVVVVNRQTTWAHAENATAARVTG